MTSEARSSNLVQDSNDLHVDSVHHRCHNIATLRTISIVIKRYRKTPDVIERDRDIFTTS
jgi:hypothetical protein